MAHAQRLGALVCRDMSMEIPVHKVLEQQKVAKLFRKYRRKHLRVLIALLIGIHICCSCY